MAIYKTGLYIKNHELQEGDIIKLVPDINYYRVIEWHDCRFVLHRMPGGFIYNVGIQLLKAYPDAEYYGNIISNPELSKKYSCSFYFKNTDISIDRL